MLITYIDAKMRHMYDVHKMKPGMVIVDAGASTGQFIQKLEEKFSSLFPSFRIYAIECASRNVDVLKKRYGKYKNVTIISKAFVGNNYMGDAVFYEIIGKGGKFYQWGSIGKTNLNHIRRDPSFIRIDKKVVKVVKIENILKEIGEETIDYLKMDIEGAEKGVINSIDGEIARNIKQISLETHYTYKYLLEVVEYLRNRKYLTFNIYKNEIYASRGIP